MSAKITAGIVGIKRIQAAFKMMGAEVRARMQQQVHVSTERVASGARARVSVSDATSRKAKGRLGPGELRSTIRDEYADDALTGFVKAGYGTLNRRSRAKGIRRQNVQNAAQFMRAQHTEALRMNNALDRAAGVYAMVIEYGSPGRGIPAQPFLRPAKDAELPALRAGVGDALRGAVDASVQPGTGA